MYGFFGVEPPIKRTKERPKTVISSANEKPEDIVKRRKKEKYELLKPFRHKIIVDFYKKKFFSLFSNRCYKCGSNESIEIDHHIPMVLGGRLVPGNLVVLCARCNSNKGSLHPDKFYTKRELSRLQGILEKEHEVFSFEFNWNAWNTDPQSYLESLGIDRGLVKEALSNPDSHYYIYIPNEEERHGIGFRVEIDIADILSEIEGKRIPNVKDKS